MSKHKSGDVVKIRSWKSMENEYGVNFAGNIGEFPYFTILKADLCGQTIRLSRPQGWIGTYLYKGLLLSDWMFEE